MSFTTTMKGIIFGLIKSNLSKLIDWDVMEEEIVMLCSDIREITSKESKKELLIKLRLIKRYFIEKGVNAEYLYFLDQEILLHSQVDISIEHNDEKEELDINDINDFSRVDNLTEGMFRIKKNYNYFQLKRLTQGIFKKTKMLKFYISNEETVKGKIISEIYEYPQKIPLIRLFKSNEENKNTGGYDYRMIMFGENVNPNPLRYHLLKEISFPFYFYKFISEENTEIILVSDKKLIVGDYYISGVKTQCTDMKTLTESTKLSTKLPFFFIYSLKNRIINFHNKEEFKKHLTKLGITRENFFDFTTAIKEEKGETRFKLASPKWYKWLIWSWVTHQKKGKFGAYPLHLMVIGPPHTGKSLGLDCLHAISKEIQGVFTGNSSTIKKLVPSFAHSPAKIGYLCESSRFSFLDEFFRCVLRSKFSGSNTNEKEEKLSFMNDILEGKRRDVGSGISGVTIQMRARAFAVTNPITKKSGMQGLMDTFDESSLTRWLIYYQGQEHIKQIKDSEDDNLESYDFNITNNQWISIVDFLHSFSATYDRNKVKNIFESVTNVLSETLSRHYSSRHKHHIDCLMDGIVKTRCLLDGDMKFIAKKEDYDILEEIWANIIKSWLNNVDIKKIPKDNRIKYLPEKAQYLFYELNKLNKPIPRNEMQKIALKEMTNNEFIENWGILCDNELIIEYNGISEPYKK